MVIQHIFTAIIISIMDIYPMSIQYNRRFS